MDEKCHKAQDIDLALFLLEPQGSEWQEFRAHYPHCAMCSAEVQKWTSLELGLRTLGNAGTNGHPSAETLVAFQQKSSPLAQEEQHKIATHLRSCAPCREEVKLLGSFDISRIQQWHRETHPITPVDTYGSWYARAWNALQSLFLHPAFAFGLVLLLSVPFIRSYYSASVRNIPTSSEVASAPAPASVKAKDEFQAPQLPLQAPASTTVVRQVPPEQAKKEDAPPAKLAKQSARREDFARKDERAVPPPPASPAPTVAASAGTREVESPARQKNRIVEEARQQRFAEPPLPAAAAEREARSTEGPTSPGKRQEEGGATRPSSARNAPPQAAALARGNIMSPESRYRTVLSSLLETYKNAYERRDLNALGTVWRVDQPWREALTQLFAQSQRIELLLGLEEEQIIESADERQLSVPLSQTLTTVNQQGQTIKHGSFFCVADIRRQPTDTWVIHKLQDDPQHPGQCHLP